ncbi:Trypsin-like peptidase domain-containing protein [Micromonospora humi]|uniref:Trypsin-like peptidase domain-containing protein n=2 Tax=Micromonospora humi TaxID=745366 RepID=A0A1C5GSR3_9ACTN|nr:Trypsin-like peptidase domain-containing protein [Micromonospora humi]
MSDAVTAWAESHLGECLVLVDGRMAGSGFFVAPGMILTCAHVAGPTASQVRVQWQGVPHLGTVLDASPPPTGAATLWPWPDLAVIRVDGLTGHPCVWLTTRMPGLGNPCVGAGYTSTLAPALKPAVGLLHLTGRHDFPPGVLLKISHEEVTPGMSGGPVLDPATGGVWGVVKAKRDHGGGFVAPLIGLRHLAPAVHRALWRAHDLHHRRADHHRRPAFDADRSGTYVVPAEERDLRGILAGLPEIPAEQHRADYERSAGPLAKPPSAPHHDYGDVAADLMGLVAPPAGEPPQVLAYAADLARRHGELPELRDWLLYRAGRLGVSPVIRNRLTETSSTAPVSVMVRLRPAGNNHLRYHVTMWRYVDADHVVPVVDDLDAVPWPEARQRVQDSLVEQIRQLTAHERDIMVEFILPQELLNEPVHSWALWRSRRWETLGSKYAVVVRDLERLEDAESMAFLKRRWRMTARQFLRSGLVSVHCDDRRSHEAMWAWIGGHPLLSAVALPGPPDDAPSRVALEVALPEGVPALAWCGMRCEKCSGDACPVRLFQSALAGSLAETRHDALPQRVLELRRAAAADNHWGRDLVLLWDDPTRRPPRQQMLPPGEAEVA